MRLVREDLDVSIHCRDIQTFLEAGLGLRV